MKIMKVSASLILIILFSCLSFSCKNKKKAKITSTKNEIGITGSLSIELEKISEESIIPGFAVNIVQGSNTIYSKGFGYSDVENSHEFSSETIHSIASISKTFIGVSIMKLVEEDKFSLDDPINDFLPFKISNPHFPESNITIRHLVTHTSSLNDDYDDGEKRPSSLVEASKYTTDEMPKKMEFKIFK